jgi:ketosteroid isomerase-like protein
VNEDEQAIREFFSKWQQASMNGDDDALRAMMADDIVFLTVGIRR